MKLRLKYISLILVILWMGVIFFLSDQPAEESAQMSSGFTVCVLNILPFTKTLPESQKLEIAAGISYTVRKGAHAGIYLVLGLLSSLLLSCYPTKNKRRILLSLLFCLLYAVSDELHQLFVPGRSCELGDVIIDFLGSGAGTAVFFSAILRIPKVKPFIESNA